MGAVHTTVVKQKTLKSAISCTGIGLHSGEKVSMTLLPADVDAGITFRRTDVAGEGTEIKGAFDQVRDTRLCTTIGSEDVVGENRCATAHASLNATPTPESSVKG